MRLGLESKVRRRKMSPDMRKAVRRIKISICILIMLFLTVVVFYWGICNARPVVIEMADNRAGDIAVQVINEAVGEEIEARGLKYEDFVSFDKSGEGKIQAINTDTSKMNSLKTGILRRVQEKMNNYETIEIQVPLGALLDIELFPGLGPRIGFEMISTGFANADFTSSFESAGINQTKHQIDIRVEAELGVVTIMGAKVSYVETSVPVAQSVIVGEVPKGYLPIDGTY